ncbi:lysylphosphatidylglycerol synthase transmembrane domain-containing protein [Pontibacter sp. SGAir0037]|uniref:lysylphosphatidylglycerol synthase transmembrane domain-containing protein n=1 Tax=Pontibacter sp. SGAir0037 TaxID=2571030 RepID=UPI0010CD056D|nr:lysylphosphatidylglycerol synthase transmembrane domain-containing protein [Pontibacter sp. SGAir0037]QCR24056.1 TIGR00374 family protein [Pontibacter sp. SGAir0037]
MKKLLSVLKYSLLLAVSAFLMWYALKELDFEKLWAELQNVNYFWIILSLLMGVAAYFSRAYRWQMQLKTADYRPSLINTYNAMMVGYVANLVLPRMGEVVRCSVLKRTNGIPVNTAFGTVIAERFIDTVMLLVALGLTFLLEFGRLRDFFIGLFQDKYNSLEQNFSSFYLLGAILLILVFLFLATGVLYFNKLKKNAFFLKVVAFVKGMLQGIFSIAKLESQSRFWAHTVFVWFMYFTMSWVVFYALPGTAHLSWTAGLSILVIGSLGMAAPVQGGVGVYHLLVQTTLLLYGVSKEAGMAYALVAHTSQTLLVVLMGVLSFIASMVKPPEAGAEATLTRSEVQHEVER